jgi:hypothetical protein
MPPLNQLVVPDVAMKDAEAFEVIRVWIAGGGIQVSLRSAVWDDPAAYGVLLCDLMKHIANAYHQNEGRDWHQVYERIRAGFDAEFGSPTDNATGT